MVGVFYDSLYLHFHICVMYLYIDLGFLWFSFPHVLFVFPRLCLYHICMWRLFTSYILWRAMIGSITHTFSLYWLSDYPKHISFPNFMSFYVIFVFVFLRIEYFLNLLVKLYLRNKRTFDSQVWSRELPIWKPVEHIPKHSPWEIVCFVCLPSSNHIMYYLLPVLQPSKEGRLATERGEVRLGVFMRQRFYVFLCCLLLNLEKKCRIHTTQMSLFDLYGVFNVQDRTQCSTLNWRPQYLNSKFKSNVCFAKSPRQSIAATSKWVLPKCIFEVLKYKYKVKGKKNFYLLKSCIQVLS